MERPTRRTPEPPLDAPPTPVADYAAWLPARPPSGRPAAGRRLRSQGEETVRKLLDAGRQTFASMGYAAARIDDVVAAAGISHGTFYLYFRNKEDLLHRLAIECGAELDVLTTSLNDLATPAPPDALAAWVDDWVSAYERHSSVVRVWLERRDLDPLMQALANDKLGGLAAALSRRLDPALAAALDPGIATLAMLSLIERMSAYLMASDGSLARDRVVHTTTSMIGAAFAG
jgi:AcrR family transcriptional regulator